MVPLEHAEDILAGCSKGDVLETQRSWWASSTRVQVCFLRLQCRSTNHADFVLRHASRSRTCMVI